MKINGKKTNVLPGPYAVPSKSEVKPTPAVMNLTRSQVRALLEASPAFHSLNPKERKEMAHNLVKIASYTAALVHDEWAQSKKLGQTPMLRQQTIVEPIMRATGAGADIPPQITESKSGPLSDKRFETLATAQAKAEEFNPRAASQVAQITEDTLNAIAFPTFVADLIKGTFQAIVDASIQQMEAYGQLLANVAKTVDEFMADNITDNQARDYMASSYPGHFYIDKEDEGARVRVRRGADKLPKPNLKTDFGVDDEMDLDDDMAEEVLVPAARRKMARNRHQVLATMVLMGVNRIVITSGKIQAQMGFRINAKDTARAESASQFDWKNETTFSYGGGLAGWLGGGPRVTSRNTMAYVSSTKKDSSDELDVHANLTGAVDLKFKSDYFPLERFADPEAITLIQGNTPNPSANTPSTGSNAEANNQTETQPTG